MEPGDDAIVDGLDFGLVRSDLCILVMRKQHRFAPGLSALDDRPVGRVNGGIAVKSQDVLTVVLRAHLVYV